MSSKLCLVIANFLFGVQVSTQPPIPNKAPLISENSCEANKAYLAEAVAVAEKQSEDSKLIVIARLGRGEYLNGYSRRRLAKVVLALRAIGNIPEEKIITAEGARTNALPSVEVYAGGRLVAIINTRQHEDIDFGANGGCDGKRDLRLRPIANKNRVGRSAPR